jgi:hypothetical protein
MSIIILTSAMVNIALSMIPSIKMRRKSRWRVEYLSVSKPLNKMRPSPPNTAPPMAQYDRIASTRLCVGSKRNECCNSLAATKVRTNAIAVMVAPITKSGFMKLDPTSDMSMGGSIVSLCYNYQATLVWPRKLRFGSRPQREQALTCNYSWLSGIYRSPFSNPGQ